LERYGLFYLYIYFVDGLVRPGPTA
jgi:hypothetical protein